MGIGFSEKHYVIRCGGKFYNKGLDKFVSQITASCLFFTQAAVLKASETLDFTHEIKVVDCRYDAGMTCEVIEVSSVDDRL